MNDNHLTFSLRNMVTVFLMWLVVWGVVSLGIRLLRGNLHGFTGNTTNDAVAVNPAGGNSLATA